MPHTAVDNLTGREHTNEAKGTARHSWTVTVFSDPCYSARKHRSFFLVWVVCYIVVQRRLGDNVQECGPLIYLDVEEEFTTAAEVDFTRTWIWQTIFLSCFKTIIIREFSNRGPRQRDVEELEMPVYYNIIIYYSAENVQFSSFCS